MLENQLLIIIGLCSGILLGLSARLGRFCSLGAVEDLQNGRNYDRALMWSVAIGWAMLCVAMAIWLGFFNIEAAIYLNVVPNYTAHIMGGLSFGFGMGIAGICGFTALARIGSGNLHALYVVLIIGITSYITANGPLAKLRETYFPFKPLKNTDTIPSFAELISNGSGVPIAGVLGLFGLALIALPMLRFEFRKSTYPFWAMLVGLSIAAGWVGTMSVALISFSDISIQSHSFSLPLGDSLSYLMTSNGSASKLGLGSVLGVIIGGLLGSLIKNNFQWEMKGSKRELHHLILGAALMGFGGVISFGCSIGQGISAMAMLSYGAPVTLASMAFGAHLGLKSLLEE